MRAIVVGAGIVGTAAAYHLARRGAAVEIVDRADPGQATAAGAGIVSPWGRPSDSPAEYRIGRASARHYAELAAQITDEEDADLGYQVVGGLTLAERPEELEDIHRLLLEQRADTPEIGDVSTLQGSEISRLFPPVHDRFAALHVAGAARVDGQHVRDVLGAAAGRWGAVRRRGSAGIAVRGSSVTGVSIDGSHVPADAVVVAAGAWTPDVCRPLGVEIPVSPQRGQIVHLSVADEGTEGWPVVHTLGRQYLLGFPGGRVVAGATREDGTGFDLRVTAAGLAEVLHQALTVAPGLGDGTVSETRVGFRPVGPDGAPLLGTLPGHENVVVATGLGPRGLTTGPYVGLVAAALALGEPPPLDVAAFAPLRDGAKG